MNKLQITTLLKLRGVTELKNESVHDAIQRTGGQPNAEEMEKVDFEISKANAKTSSTVLVLEEKEEQGVVKIERKEMETAYSEFFEYQDEIDAIEQSRTDSKVAVEEEYKEILTEINEKLKVIDKNSNDSLTDSKAKQEAAQKILQKYISQNGNGTVVLPNKGSFGFFDKSPAYIIKDEKNALETLTKFKNHFKRNWNLFLTAYPKFKVADMRNNINNKFVTEEELEEMGIVYSCDKDFKVKPAKK